MKISQFRCHCSLWWLIRQSVKRTDEVKYGPLKPVSFSTMAVAYDTTFLIFPSGKIFQSGKYFRSNQNGPKLEFLVIKNGTFIWKHHHFEQSLLSTAQGGAEFFSSFNQIWKAWFRWDFLSFGQDIWINKFKQGSKIYQNGKKWLHSEKRPCNDFSYLSV